MASQEDIEATRRKSQEILAASEDLMRQAESLLQVPTRLEAEWERELGRFAQILQTASLSAEAQKTCAMTTLELIGDFAEVEIAMAEVLMMGANRRSRSKPVPPRAGRRRGLRI